MMDRLGELFKLYYNKTASLQEREELMELLRVASSSDLVTLANLIRESGEKLEIVESGLPAEKANSILATILGKSTLHAGLSSEGGQASVELQPTETLPKIHRIHFLRTRWWAAAAIFILFAAGSFFLFFNKGGKKQEEIVRIEPEKDVEAPKGTKAMITLADGRKISIDSLTIINQSSVQLTKTTDGKIVYSGNAKEVVYNILTNPRGSRVIDITLSDGSHVWLNAGSSIRYPISFVGKERRVSITGEAYFEITKNPSQPFRVSLPPSRGNAGGEVEVLGTHFNVNAYEDEADIKVTLLEGSVKLSTANGQRSAVIKPGQQARAAADGGLRTMDAVDVDQVMAWKNGLFEFSNTELPVILRQISRWYDVDIVYETKPGKEKYGGGLSRQLPLSSVLKLLEANEVKFTLDGKTLRVRP